MKKRYLLSAMGILRLVWLVSLIVREATLSRADLDPFLRLFFSFLLAIILMESSLASKKLSFLGTLLLMCYYLLVGGGFLLTVLMIPWDYFELWTVFLIIVFLMLFAADRSIRGAILKYFGSRRKEKAS